MEFGSRSKVGIKLVIQWDRLELELKDEGVDGLGSMTGDSEELEEVRLTTGWEEDELALESWWIFEVRPKANQSASFQ